MDNLEKYISEFLGRTGLDGNVTWRAEINILGGFKFIMIPRNINPESENEKVMFLTKESVGVQNSKDILYEEKYLNKSYYKSLYFNLSNQINSHLDKFMEKLDKLA